MIDFREEGLEPPKKKSGLLKLLIVCGVFLDLVLIAVFLLWLLHSKSLSEFDMLAEEMKAAEKANRELLEQLENLEETLPLEYSGDVVLSISDMLLNKMEEGLFPTEFDIKDKYLEGRVRVEELSHFKFVADRKILFRMKIIGMDLKYNPRGNSLADRMLAKAAQVKRLQMAGTGEILFTFDEDLQRLDMRMNITGIDFDSSLPQFAEKKIKDRFKGDLRDKPHFVKLDFKPIEAKFEDRTTWGYYHVRDVVTVKNRLMAIADITFKDEPPPDKKKKKKGKN